jgi:hypothetical protein
MGWLVGYIVAAGTLNATLQVARGLTRGAGKLIEGRPREALGEAAGGLLAPLLQAADQYARLALDAYSAAAAIAGQGAGTDGDRAGLTGLDRCGRPPATAWATSADGVCGYTPRG